MICDNCHEHPAIYGDGVTEALCSKCYWEKHPDIPSTGEQTAPVEEGIPHQLLRGLTSIIIPIYNTNYSLFHYTGNCIGSVREHTASANYELIVVDNGSPIPVPSLNSYYADKVIKNESNLGFTKAVNQGIRASFGEYIVLLNNDTQVYNGWLETLREALNSYDLVMAHPMYSLTEPFARAEEARQVMEGTKVFDKLQGKSDFSCVMFRKSLLDEIGLFDEQFISWCSDADLLRRMDEAGKTYQIIDKVAIHHVSDATGYSMGEEAARIMDEDKKRYEEKWSKREEIVATEVATVYYTHVKMGDKIIEGLVRTPKTGDAIYLLLHGKYHHVKDPQTLQALGANLGDEATIPDLEGFEKGDEINMANVGGYA